MRQIVGLAILRVLAIVCVALYLVLTGANFFELPNKMALSPPDYLLLQAIYRGWAWFGAVGLGALLLTLCLPSCDAAGGPSFSSRWRLSLEWRALRRFIGCSPIQ